MASIPVIVKHQGTKYEVDLDPEATGEEFKYQVYSLTNVEPERQKILIKGGQLKDDTPLSSLKAKAGQQFMMMGTPSGDPASQVDRPAQKIRFLEDMTEAEAAQVSGATPAGLQNLGNTCYLNSALQTLRSMPELSEALDSYKDSGNAGPSSSLGNLSEFGLSGLGSSTDLTGSLRDLYKQMGETQQGFPPLVFLNALRQSYPQFSQKAKDGHGYAQQDAEEAWSSIVQMLRQKLQQDGSSSSSSGNVRGNNWVDKFMAGQTESVMTCDESSATEEPVKGSDVFFKLDCNIRGDTNHLREGVNIALNETIEKRSESLGREATYTKSSRISRLPKYMPVHFVRFFWRKDTQKKAKIMRKVTFPMELDAVEFCTDELKKQLIPIRDRIREVRKEEEDVERAKKRQKRMKKEHDDLAGSASEPLEKRKEKEKDTETQSSKQKKDVGMSASGGDTEMGGTESYKTDAEIERERAEKILAMRKDLLAQVSPTLAADESANQTGLYELRAVITHQGSSADSGHYTSYIKKTGRKNIDGSIEEEDGKWWWFNDDKVSEVEADKVETLSGGGESHSALILLYKAVELPSKKSIEDAEKALA
ncbi:cysteine proteinase [Aureobasidium subglaciale]|nr:cysteine proteinase [Aureobasidium subglaciale]KAI5221793.1 cysteine proteinase [Aureobasidium subglaciale]KAI5225833.1 cysteine proteinase [Aureobasidium subglaciale]KAI5238978.1 cysteine proteinase [Aureobasidium subglaciale]KAI5261656.1 cysteine proteinase [Aureobasidium subglaciale]